jgi:hypothetical protein
LIRGAASEEPELLEDDGEFGRVGDHVRDPLDVEAAENLRDLGSVRHNLRDLLKIGAAKQLRQKICERRSFHPRLPENIVERRSRRAPRVAVPPIAGGHRRLGHFADESGDV